jgi:hypothetical protein
LTPPPGRDSITIMHSILFSIAKPDQTSIKVQQWHYLVTALFEKAQKDKSIQSLGFGAWLFVGADGLPALGEAIADSQHRGLEYRILIIEKASNWTPAPTAAP